MPDERCFFHFIERAIEIVTFSNFGCAASNLRLFLQHPKR
jgi:hypothetical protein